MATIRRIAIDANNPDGAWTDPAFAGYPYKQVFFNGNPYVALTMDRPIMIGGQPVSNVYIWSAGFITFATPSDAQVAFEQEYLNGQKSLLELPPAVGGSTDVISTGQTFGLTFFYVQNSTNGFYIDWGDPIENQAEGDFDSDNCGELLIRPDGSYVIDTGLGFTDELLAYRLNNAGYLENRDVTSEAGGNGRVLRGGSSNDTIKGLSAADELRGGGGNDVLIGNGGADIFEGGDGTDTAKFLTGDFLDINLATGLAREHFANGTVRYTAQLITIENVEGSESADVITGDAFANVLNGNGGNDTIFGGAGNDALYGADGIDTVYGGLGDDVISVNAAADMIFEAAGEGNDRVTAFVSYVLPAGAEIETIETDTYTGTGAINLTGNDFAQAILGNSGANRLDGQGGNDTLHGYAGNDYLYGATGFDNMYGGTGDDAYYMATDDGDRVWEFAGEGYDVVSSEVNYTLPDVSGVERIEAGTLGATTPLYLGGSNFDNAIYGNAGNNTLRGFLGNDTLHGFGGDDILIGDEGADVMYGEAGNDTYYINTSDDRIFESVGEGTADRAAIEVSYALPDESEIETLEVVNSTSTAAIDLTGSRYANLIVGNNGANRIDGKGGNDVLVGLGGADTFVFSTALGAGNVDRVEGFAPGNDTIALDDAVFTAIATGALAAGAFVVAAAAQDTDDRIIYNSATGALFYDPDGTGAAAQVQFASLSSGLALASSDFLLV